MTKHSRSYSKNSTNSIYNEIEQSIIKWVSDDTRTAGSLTRDIIAILEKKNFDNVYDEYKGVSDLLDFIEYLNDNYYPVKK
jgi:hypothetical protein